MSLLQSSQLPATTSADRGARGAVPVLIGVLLLIALAVASVRAEDLQVKGWLSVGLLAVLLALSVPVGASMGVAGVLTLFSIGGTATVDHVLRTEPHSIVASWSLSVLPMFVFMGLLLWRSGATDRMYRAALAWLGWLPGGLAVTTNAVGGALGAASGSTLGITYAVGRIGLPAMLRAGYPKQLAVASVLMAGSGGQLIPPSIALVVFASLASVPVGSALMAGLVPGVLLNLLYCLVLVAVAMRMAGRVGADHPRASRSERRRSLLGVWPVPAIISMIIGGMYFGIFTATEAGAFGAGAALALCAWLRRGESRQVIGGTIVETLSATGSIFFLLVGGAVFARALSLSGVTQAMTEMIVDAGIGRVTFLLGLVVLYLVLGTFLDPLAMLLLTVPPLLPLLAPLGIDPIWFGAFVVLMAEISFVTPPVGVLLYVVHRIAQDPQVSLGHAISLRDVLIAALWGVLPVALGVVGLLIAFPELALWLPAQFGD